MINKRGAIWVLFLVFFVVILDFTAVIIFVSNDSRTEESKINYGILDNLYIKEEKLNFYLDKIIRESVVDGYYKMIEEGKFTGKNIISNGLFDINYFDEGAVKIDFMNKVKSNIKIKSSDYIKENDFSDFRAGILNGNSNVNLEDDVFNFKFNEDGRGFFEVGGEGIDVIYRPVFNFSLNITKMGLEDFKSFYNAYKDCKSEKNVEFCVGFKIGNFDVSIDESKARFESKNEFLIDGEMKKMVIEFGR